MKGRAQKGPIGEVGRGRVLKEDRLLQRAGKEVWPRNAKEPLVRSGNRRENITDSEKINTSVNV